MCQHGLGCIKCQELILELNTFCVIESADIYLNFATFSARKLKQVKDFTLTETMLCGKIDDAILTNMFCSEDLCCNLAIIAITLSLHSFLNF